MTSLPRALAQWAEPLSWFGPETGGVIGTHLLRLSGLLGPSAGVPRDEGEPDGYSGIARRGSYERLLISEWLLQEEIPDEFLRRAVAGEHTFFQREYRQRSGPKLSVALFDVGLDQFGAPRVVQLALLILLSSRAEKSKSLFAWAAVQDAPPTGLSQLAHGLNPAALRRFMAHSSLRDPTAAGIQAWLALAADDEVELLLVGGASLRRLIEDCQPDRPANITWLIVEEQLVVGEPVRLQVTRAQGEAQRSVSLALPDEAAAIRLLRGAFAPKAQPAASTLGEGIAVGPRPVISRDQRTLFCAGSDGGVLVFPLPNSPRAPPGRASRYSPRPPGAQGELCAGVVAAGYSFAHKRRVVLCASDGKPTLRVLSRRGGSTTRIIPLSGSIAAAEKPELSLLVPARAPADMGGSSVDSEEYLCVVGGRVRHIAWGACNTVEIAGKILAVAGTRDGVVLAVQEAQRVSLLSVKPGAVREVSVRKLQSLGAIDLDEPLVLLGDRLTRFTCTYRLTSGLWRVVGSTSDPQDILVPPGYTPIGVGGEDSKPCLLALDAAARRVLRLSGRKPQLVYSSDEAIVTTACSGLQLAMVTRSGRLIAYSLLHEGVVLDVRGGTPK